MAGPKYFKTKWICQQDNHECDGYFHLRGAAKKIPCPLENKCRAAQSRTGYVEYKYEREIIVGRVGWCLKEERVTEAEAKARVSERNALKRLFDGETVRAKARAWEAENWDYLRVLRRGYGIQQSWETLAPDRVPLNARKNPPPPCGGDCRNCEKAENPERDCPYLDWDEQFEAKRKKAREAEKRYKERQKAKEAADPEYAAKQRAKRMESTRRYRARKKAYIEAQKTKGARTDGKGREQGAGHAAAGGSQGEMCPGGAGRGYDPGGV